MLGHKTNLNNFKKTEIILSVFSDNKGMKLEINYKKKTEKHTNMWRLNNMLLSNEWVNIRLRKKSKDTLTQKKIKTLQVQIYGT